MEHSIGQRFFFDKGRRAGHDAPARINDATRTG
jgi:hypothetical protein